MSKTLGIILEIGVGIAAIAVGPGGIAAGFAKIGIKQGLASTLGSVLFTTGISVGLTGVQGLLQSAAKPETTDSPLKSPRPPRVSGYGRQRLYGAYNLYETASDGTAVDVWAIHDGEIDGIEQFYIGDDKVTLSGSTVQPGADGRYKNGAVNIYSTLGTSPGTANFAAIKSLLPGIWTDAHRGDGVAIVAATWKSVKAKDYQEVYPSAGPQPVSIAARLQKVYDWRDPSQSVTDRSTWKWSENPVLHTAHYQLVRNAKDWATHFAPTLAYWTAAANDCDSPRALKAGGSEPRYRSCVTHKHTDDHKSVLGALLATFDGWMAPCADGALVVYSGRYVAPTVTIGPDEIVSYSWEDGVEDESAVNEIVVSYVSAPNDFNMVETDAWLDEDDISTRGALRSTNLENQVPSHAQARALAKRYQAKAMAPSRGTVTTNSAGRIVRGQRYINLHLEEAGAVFFSGPVEVTQLTRNLATGGVTFAWIAADPNIDSWNPATEEGSAAAVGNRVAAEPLDPPTITAATVDFGTESGSDSAGAFLHLTVTGPDRADLTWFARTRVAGAAVWGEREYTDIDPGASVTINTEFVPTNASVEVEVAYAVGDGRVSPWSETETVDTATDQTAPDAATVPTLQSWINSIDLTTTAIPRATSYRWRFYKADGTTLLATIGTATPSVSYSAAQAIADGVERSYVVDVAGVNGAGAGTAAATTVLTKAAPAAVTSPAIAGGATTATATCDSVSGATGYVVFYSDTTGFDPSASGGVVTSGLPSIPIYGLAAGSYYGRIAAYDAWTANPALLNLSGEIGFTIATGGGGTPSGGGTGGGGYTGGGRGGGAIP